MTTITCRNCGHVRELPEGQPVKVVELECPACGSYNITVVVDKSVPVVKAGETVVGLEIEL